MKNRRNIIVAFLLCACLIVGVGFAELNDDLVITGSATISNTEADEAFEADIYFTAASNNGVAANTANVDANDNDKATFTATAFTEGNADTATFTFTVMNDNEDYAASLVATVIADNSVAAGATTTITVTVTMIKTPIEDDVTATFTIDITATAIDNA